MSHPVVIAGGGCAGLSLAVHLVERGYQGPITIFEPRSAYREDRTWGMWRFAPHPFSACVTHEYPRWRAAYGHRDAVCYAPRHPYQRLPSARFYAAARARLERASNVSLHLGESVRAARPTADGVAVETDSGELHAGYLFDSRPRPLAGPEPALVQHFAGYRVRLSRDVLDPETATLMDFAPAAREGVRFVYVLPLSPRAALVEATWFSTAPAQADYAAEVAAYLERRRLPVASLDLAEAGQIPMTPAPASTGRGRLQRIGIAAGMARPSSGYTFDAIQRHSAHVAAALVAGHAPPPFQPWRRRTRLLDRIFLTYLYRHPERAPELFVRLFARVPAESLARFLADRGSLADDLRVIASLPAGEMTREAAHAGRMLLAGAR